MQNMNHLHLVLNIRTQNVSADEGINIIIKLECNARFESLGFQAYKTN